MKVRVYYDHGGRIASIVEVKEDKGAPPAGLFPVPDCQECELELTDAQARMSLIALHIGYKVDLTQELPRLVPLITDKDKRRKVKSRSKK